MEKMEIQKQQLTAINKKVKNLIEMYSKHKQVFGHYNYKVHSFFYELYKNDYVLEFLGITNDDVTRYLNDRWDLYQDYIRYSNVNFTGKEKQFNRTSWHFLAESYYLDNTYFKYDDSFNNIFEHLGINSDNIFTAFQEIQKLFNGKNLLKLLQAVQIEFYYNDWDTTLNCIIEYLDDIKNDFLDYMKFYYFIQQQKSYIDIYDFLEYVLYTADITDVIENQKIKYISESMMENIYRESDYKIIATAHGKKAKIYFSYAKEPLIIDVVPVQTFLSKIQKAL